MSRRYEFLEDGASLISGEDLLDLNEDWTEADIRDGFALVLGNPYATAGVLYGTRESIANQLRTWLALVEPMVYEQPRPKPPELFSGR